MTMSHCVAASLLAFSLHTTAAPVEPALAGEIDAAEAALATRLQRPGNADATGAARGRLALLYLAAERHAEAQALLLANAAARAADPGSRGLLSGRGLLLSGQAEPEGYGLYSYLLFQSPPRDDAERHLYLSAIETHLTLLPALAELERYQRRSRINLTLLPLRHAVDLPMDGDAAVAPGPAAERVLNAYDYPRAGVLLDRLGRDGAFGGPFLAARPGLLAPTEPAAEAARLFMDLSQVSPVLLSDWMRSFCWLAAGERPWTAVALQRLSLSLRNAIAVAARQLPGPAAPTSARIVFGPVR